VTSGKAGKLIAAGIVSAAVSLFLFREHALRRPVVAACTVPGDPAEAGMDAAALVRRRTGFSAGTGGPRLETNPAAADYDPARLGKAVGVDTLFKAEPRSEAWAARVERELGPVLESSLKSAIPELISFQFECRTTVCALRWALAPGSGGDVNLKTREAVRQLFPGLGKVIGGQTRYAVWQGKGVADVRDASVFLPAARDRIESMGRFLRSSTGQRFLTQVLPPKPEAL
jgi:hypothetical protein